MRGGWRQERRGRATRGLVAFLLAGLLGWAGVAAAETDSRQVQAPDAAGALTLAAGTKIEVAVVRPLPAKTAKAGDTLYGQTNYPVALGDRIAIPAGTWVEGRIRVSDAAVAETESGAAGGAVHDHYFRGRLCGGAAGCRSRRGIAARRNRDAGDDPGEHGQRSAPGQRCADRNGSGGAAHFERGSGNGGNSADPCAGAEEL